VWKERLYPGFLFTGYAFEHIGIPFVGLLIAAISLLCGISWLVQFVVKGRAA
jgi:hypothetical protein